MNKSRTTIITDKNSFVKNYPQLLKEWDYEFNNKNNIYPDKLTNKNASVKPGWICETCETKWTTTIAIRTGGSGCPECNKAINNPKKHLYLAKDFPHLLRYWDKEQNDIHNIDHTTVSCFSNKKAYWKCDCCDNKWKSSFIDVVKRKRLCKICKKNELLHSRTKTCNVCANIWDSSIRETCSVCVDKKQNQKLIDIVPNLLKYFFLEKNFGIDINNILYASKQILTLSCDICIEDFTQMAYSIYKNGVKKCTNCLHIKKAENNVKKEERYKLRQEKNSNKLNIFQYNPVLITELHPTKNKHINLHNLSIQSLKQLDWVCNKCNFEWKASLRVRCCETTKKYNSGQNCPVCC